MGNILDLRKNNHPLVMGVLNITPDSFSDGGKYLEVTKALDKAEQLAKDGSNIIDIGGESSRPGSTSLSAEDELKRIEQVVKILGNKYFLSIDTYKAKTAQKCLELGAKMINDISAFRAQPEIAKVAKDANCFVILMHSKEKDSYPLATKESREYKNLIQEIADFLNKRVEFALSQGISESKIILDPGMGGFLSPNDNYSWELLDKLNLLVEKIEPFPLLIGTSRKGFLASKVKFSGNDFEHRDPISQLTSLNAYLKGASIIRTHNPKMFLDFVNCWNTTV